MANLTTINRVRYAGLDFDTLEDDLRARLQAQFAASFNDFSVSSLGIVLLDIVSFGLDTLSFYLDRRATDTYLATARTRRSVSLLTRQLGYKMGGAVASSVDLQIAATQAYGFPLPIPKGFQFLGPNGLIFEAAQAVTIASNSLATYTIPTYQGQTTTETFVSTGNANQVFTLSRVPSGSDISQGTVLVTVNGMPWVESDFISFDATNQYEIAYNDQPPTIRFGDGVAGNIPVLNGSIVVNYVATAGASGQALSGTITNVVTPLVISLTQISLSITNAQNTVGGSDAEDLDHAKTFAPKVFKSRQVAVTAGDYEALAGAFADPLFGRVAVAQAISARSAANDLELQTLLIAVQSYVNGAVTSVQTAINDPTIGELVLLNTILAAATQLQSDLTPLAQKLTTVNSNLTNILTSCRTVKTNSGEAQENYSDAHTLVGTAKSAIQTVRIAAPIAVEQIHQTTVDNIVNLLNKIDTLLGLVNNLAASSGAAADSATSAVNTTQSLVSVDIGTSVTSPASLLLDLQTQTTAILTAAGIPASTGVPSTSFYAQIDAILAASTFGQAGVNTTVTSIADHVDQILAADCQANLVSVPILARDAAGFYAAPSIGLVRALQNYLDGIKEVTQTVSVTSGAGFLIPAIIKVRVAVRQNVSQQVTAASVTSIVDGVLRDRAFGESLYVSDLLTPVLQVTGVVFANVTITGWRSPVTGLVVTTNNDSNGNLIINNSLVITLSESDFVVTTELFTS
jgi:hypothetical protein